MLQLAVDGQDFLDAQAFADGADQEMCRGGDDQQAVAGRTVSGQAAHGVAVDDRLDHVFDVPTQQLHRLAGPGGRRVLRVAAHALDKVHDKLGSVLVPMKSRDGLTLPSWWQP